MTDRAAATTAPQSGMARLDQAGMALFLLTNAIVALLLCTASMRDCVLRFVHDDAFYYFGIAHNWALTGKSTFDGLTLTNGYHPLWEWLLLAPAALLPNVELLVRYGSAVGALLLAVAGVLLVRFLRRAEIPYAGFAAWWVLGTLAVATIHGLESPLAALLLAITVLQAWRFLSRPTTGQGLLLGFSLGALFLARIDTLIWTGALFGLLALENRRTAGRLRPAALATAFAIATGIIGAYFVSNSLLWGHPLTVSAMVKAGRTPSFSFHINLSLLMLTAYAATLCGLPACWSYARLYITRSAAWAPGPLLATWLTAANALYLLGLLLRGGEEIYNWYYVVPTLSGALLLPLSLDQLKCSPVFKTSLYRLSVLGCVVLLCITIAGKRRPGSFVDAYDQAMKLRTLPAYSRTFALTDCGVIGTLSNQHCINIDGLTCSFEFQEALRENRAAEFLRKLGINTYIFPAGVPPAREATARIPAGIAGVPRQLHYTLTAPLDPETRIWSVASIQ
jgi:hypothetical protein